MPLAVAALVATSRAMSSRFPIAREPYPLTTETTSGLMAEPCQPPVSTYWHLSRFACLFSFSLHVYMWLCLVDRLTNRSVDTFL